MNPRKQARNPYLMGTWADEQKVQKYSLWNQRRCYFGGGGSKIKAVDPYAQTNYRDIYNQFTKWLQPQMGGVTPYPGQMVPGPSDLQQAGFDVAQGLTPIASGGQQYFGNMLGQADPSAPGRAMGMAEQGLQNVMQPFDPSTITEGLQPARDLAMDTFGDISRVLKERSVAGAGTADTGGLDRAMAREGGRLSLRLGAQAMPYMFQGQQNQLGRQQQGVGQAQNQAQLPGQILGQAGQVGGQGMNMLSQLLNMGGMQRGITGEQMQEPYQKWQTEQPYNNPWINILGSLQGSAPQMDYLSQGQAPGLGSQLLPMLGGLMGMPGGMSALGGGLSSLLGTTGVGGMTSSLGAGSGLLGLLSDVRVKEGILNIQDSLEKVNQLKGYIFNFKGEENRVAGILAQDLEKVLPEGIIEHEGLKYIRVDAVLALLVNAINELNDKVEMIGV